MIQDLGATARNDERLSLCDPSWQYCHHIPPLRQWTEEAMFRRCRLVKRNFSLDIPPADAFM